MAWMQTVLDQSAFSGRLQAIFLIQDSRLDIRNYLPASQVPWLTDPASECEMKKHSTSIQCSDFQLRNLYPNLEMYWEPEVFNHCKYLSKVLLCCVHKSRRWPCASPSDLDALHFSLLSYFFLGIILRFNFWPGPRAEIIERDSFCFIRRGNGAVWIFVLLQVVRMSSWTNTDPFPRVLWFKF